MDGSNNSMQNILSKDTVAQYQETEAPQIPCTENIQQANSKTVTKIFENKIKINSNFLFCNLHCKTSMPNLLKHIVRIQATKDEKLTNK